MADTPETIAKQSSDGLVEQLQADIAHFRMRTAYYDETEWARIGRMENGVARILSLESELARLSNNTGEGGRSSGATQRMAKTLGTEFVHDPKWSRTDDAPNLPSGSTDRDAILDEAIKAATGCITSSGCYADAYTAAAAIRALKANSKGDGA